MNILLVSNIVLWVLFLALGVAVLALYRHFGQLYINSPEGRASQGPELGSSLLALAEVSTRGVQVSIPMGRPSAIIFADTTCTLCAEVRTALVTEPVPERYAVIAFCAGRTGDVESWARGLPANVHVVPDHRQQYSNKFEVNGTPYVVVADALGRVRSKSIINGVDGVRWISDELNDIADEAARQGSGV